MSEQTLEEKYFTATFNNDGSLEAVYWHKTLKEAKSYARMLRKKFPTEKDEIIFGERLG